MRKLLFIFLLLSVAAAQNSAADRLLAKFVLAETNLIVDGEFTENLIFLNRKPKDKKNFIYPAAISLELVKENYNLQIIEEKQLLARDVVVLRLEPKQAGPYWQFTIDKLTGSRLAYQQISPSGEILAEGAYSKIRKIIKRTTPRPFKKLELSAEKRNFYERFFINPQLPKGYIPVKITRSSIGQGKIPALRISFFDGLNTLILLLILDNSKLDKDSQSVQTMEINHHILIATGPIAKDSLIAWLEAYKNSALNRLNRDEIRSLFRAQ